MIGTSTKRSTTQSALAFGLRIVALLVLVGILVGPAHALPTDGATFTVNSTSDAGDTSPDGVCGSNATATVTCTLREAIQEANASTTTDDTIDFAIPASGCNATTGVCTIFPASGLPAITDTVTVNGYTQAGASVNSSTTNTNNAALKIELNGRGAGTFPPAAGLVLSGTGAAESEIFGLVINGFAGSGVVAASGSVAISGNFIGTDPTGSLDRGNGFDGVRVTSPGNLIGGAQNERQNVISGNGRNGVSVVGTGATGNVVSNNHIGTDADAGADLGNSQSGVFVTSPGAVVGGSSADGTHNIISGNDEHGVLIANADGTRVLGNLIGLDRNGFGFSNVGNTLDGVEVQNAPRVEIGGTLAGQGNTISDNGEHGVEIIDSVECKVLGNNIGTNASASSAVGNTVTGVSILDAASDNLVGGPSAGARNIISGNGSDGVVIGGLDSTNNRIEGNFIGTDGTGVKDLGNAGSGVNITVPSGNFVGGRSAGAGNLISGNNGRGVLIAGDAADNVVQGNFIGTNASGTADLGNGAAGVEVFEGLGNLIGGTAPGSRNVISGNDAEGVKLNLAAQDSRVEGNFVGTDRNGTADLGNALVGVVVLSSGNVVGGTAAGAGNLISGNAGSGVALLGTASTGNQVQGNLIGTDVSGTADLGNGFYGVKLDDAVRNTIGGTAGGAGNTISGNDNNGINLDDPATMGNRIEGNFIGTTSDGTGDVGNAGIGVRISGAPGNFVGGGVAGAGNVISGNEEDGVVISGAGATANRILRNSIFANGGLGIDLRGGTENAAGATANDPQDPDTGPNTLQNKPVIRSATTTGSSVTVSGNLNSTPNKTFAIQFFSNPSSDEGETFLAQRSVTTNSKGNAPFTFTLSVSVAAGPGITATATGAGNTSELSGPRIAQAP